MAKQLQSSVKIGDTFTYGETHSEFNKACKNLVNATTFNSYEKVCEEDIKTVFLAMQNDWEEYTTVNSSSYQSYKNLYYGDKRQPLEIMGVVYSENFSKANSTSFTVFSDIDFVKNNSTYYVYRQERRTTSYMKPTDERYSFIMSPTKNAVHETKYIINMADRNVKTNVSYFWQNELYSEAMYFGETFSIYGFPFFIISLVLGLFAALLLFNYLSASIIDRQKEIGVLRALGARSADVFKIFFSESAIISTICFIFSVISSAIICMIFDPIIKGGNLIKFSILNFGIINILLIFSIALVVCFAGTIIPVLFSAKKSPVESIKSL